MRSAMPRVYQSFEEFEREEIRKLDSMGSSIDDMLGEIFADELDFEPGEGKRGRKQDEDEEE